MDKKVLMGWSFNVPEYANVTSALKHGCHEDGQPCTFLTLLCGCLISLMKILNSMMGSQMANIICKTINADIPYVPWLTGYLGMLVGAVITILVRSSSVFTSTLTPLCGTGVHYCFSIKNKHTV